MTRAADLHFKQGLAYQNRGQHRLAIREYEAALEINPGHVPSMTNLGILLMIIGETAKAIDVFGAVIDAEPDCADNYYNYGKALYRNSRISEALDAFIKAEGLCANDAAIIRSIADCHVALANHDKALIKLQELTVLLPEDITAFLDLGKAHLTSGHLGEARQAFQEALELDQDSADAHLNLGEVLRKAGLFEEAITHFQEASSLAMGRVETYLGTARAYRDAGKIDEALNEINTALSYEPSNSDALSLLHEIKNPPEHLIVFSAEGAPPTPKDPMELMKSADYIEKKVRKLFALEDWDRAVEELQNIVDLAPTRLAILRLSQALVKKGDRKSAIVKLRTVIKDDPSDIELGTELVNLSLEDNDLEGAISDIKALTEALGEDPRVLLLASRVHLKAGDRAEAQECLQKLLALEPGMVDTYIALSEIAYSDGRVEDALRLWETAYRYDPDRHEILFMIAASQYRMRRYSQAQQTLKSYVKCHPGDIAARGLMAEIFLKLKKVRAAKNEWHSMVELAPGTPQDAVARAKALLFLGHTSQSRDALELCVKAHGETASALFYLGVTDLISNDIQSSAENWLNAWTNNKMQTEGALTFLKDYFNSEKIKFVADELSRTKAPSELVDLIRSCC